MPSLSSPARRSSTARSLFSLRASLSRMLRRQTLPRQVRRLKMERRAISAEHLAVDVAVAVAVEAVIAALAVG